MAHVRAPARARRVCGSRRWKASRIEQARLPFTRRRVEAVLAAFDSSLRSGTDCSGNRGRRQRRPGCGRLELVEGRTIPTRFFERLTQRFARREARGSPVSLASEGPEPVGARSFVSGRERVARLNAARREHEAQASDTREVTGENRLVSTPGAHEARGYSELIGSECRRRSVRISDRDALGREQRPRKRAT